MKYRVVIVRHGETYLNVFKRFKAKPWWFLPLVWLQDTFPFLPYLDPVETPLTPRGKDQAIEVGQWLRDILGDRPVGLVCSPMKRAKQTAALFKLERKWHLNPVFTERSFGEKDKASMELTNGCLDDPNTTIGAESDQYFIPRVDHALKLMRDYLSVYEVNDLVVVCHGEVIGMILSRLLGLSTKRRDYFNVIPPNCGSVIIQADNLSDLSTTGDRSALRFTYRSDQSHNFAKLFPQKVAMSGAICCEAEAM